MKFELFGDIEIKEFKLNKLVKTTKPDSIIPLTFPLISPVEDNTPPPNFKVNADITYTLTVDGALILEIRLMQIYLIKTNRKEHIFNDQDMSDFCDAVCHNFSTISKSKLKGTYLEKMPFTLDTLKETMIKMYKEKKLAFFN